MKYPDHTTNPTLALATKDAHAPAEQRIPPTLLCLAEARGRSGGRRERQVLFHSTPFTADDSSILRTQHNKHLPVLPP
jgi:hypothetical protein